MTTSAAERASAPGRFRRRRSLNGLALQLSAVALSFILVALLVVHTSQQAFTAQTANLGNLATAGQLTLTDSQGGSGTTSGTAMFSASGLVPSTVVQKCITVTYNGTVSPYPAIKLYAKSPPTTSSGTNLATYLNLTVEMGTGTSDAAANCTSFSTPTTIYPTNTLANFASSYPSYATSLATWTPTASPSPRTFRFTIQVQDTTAAQGLNTTFGFQWETQVS